MKKLINDPDDVVDEMLDGMTAAYPDRLRRLPDTQVVVRNDAPVGEGRARDGRRGAGTSRPTRATSATACSTGRPRATCSPRRPPTSSRN